MGIANQITDLIGNTPMIKLSRFHNEEVNIFAKLEMFNPLSSVKDRIGLAMIEDAENSGEIGPGSVLIEPTSGNTGIALAYVAAVKGYPLILTMPETMSIERRKLLEVLGAKVVLTDAYEGMDGAIDKAKVLAKSIPGAYILQQFSNPSNPKIHAETTAQEILRDTNGNVDILVLGVGTGGTITGVGQVLKQHNPDLKIVAVEPYKSAVLSGGQAAPHRIQGLGAGFIPDVLNADIIDEIITVKDEQASEASRHLARSEGIVAGISSGAALHACLEIAKKPENQGKNILTVLPDTGERYLSTWLFEGFEKSEAEIIIDNYLKENSQTKESVQEKEISGDSNNFKKHEYGELSEVVEKTLHYYRNGFYCSEGLVKAFNEVYDLGMEEQTRKVATGFGLGLGEAGCACGAVTGGVTVLSWLAGRTKVYESERIVQLAVRELHDRFRARHKAICCRVLTKPVKWQSAEHKKHCEVFVVEAASITEDILLNRLKEFIPNSGKMKAAPKKYNIIEMVLWIKKKLYKKRSNVKK